MVRDSVLKFCPYSQAKIFRALVESLRGSGLNLVVKKHPAAVGRNVGGKFHELIDRVVESTPFVHLSAASIHSLIPRSRAVVTVNSGVGFEGLMHLKNVFTLGKCDYAHATQFVGELSRLRRLPELIQQPPDENRIKAFLYYYLACYAVDLDDRSDIWNKFNRRLNLDSAND